MEAIVLLEKSKPALEGVSKEGDEMATVNIGEIGVLKRVCSTPWQVPAASSTGEDPFST